MARMGSLPEWERRLAAQRQEDNRLAREQARQARGREKARQHEHLDSQEKAAETRTAEIERQITTLDEILTSVLALPPLSFTRLMSYPGTPRFDPGSLGLAVPAPDWSHFAPAEPRGLRRLLGGAARYRGQMTQAQAMFAAAQAEHWQQESQRQQGLTMAKARYHENVTRERARAAAQNAHISRRRAAFAAGDPESVEWFTGRILDTSRYPDGFPREHQVAYHPDDREVVVEFGLPPQQVVPPVRAYRYFKARDVTEPVRRPQNEIAQRYQRLISCVALRTLHEIFGATPPEVIETIAFTGFVTIIDGATGKPAHSHLFSVSAERSVFDDLVLAAVEPAACLTYLNAPGAPQPSGAEPFLA